MAGPIDPRLLRRARATRGYLVAGVAVGSATAILTLGQAWLLSRSVSDIFATGQLTTLGWAVGGLVAVFGLKALLSWLNEWLAQRASAAVKSQLRRDIMAARLERPLESTASGGLVTLITQGLDGLDGYFSKYLPQLLLAVTVPLIIGVAILSSDLLSAVILAVTLPLIPVFMALVGWMTESITKKRWAVQTRLANHFADLVAGLPTLQVFGRARAQARGLQESEGRHRSETMRTLRVSFLSALVLELLATLSVALIAVTIGFRVVYGQVDLTTALFVLILAPEAYLPVRQVGVHYHDAADGLAAVESAFALIDPPAGSPSTLPEQGAEPARPTTTLPEQGAEPARLTTTLPEKQGAELAKQPASRRAAAGTALLSVRDVTHTYPGGTTPALAPVSFDIHSGEVVALAGPSGSGKTTLLNAVMGFLVPTGGALTSGGEPLGRLPHWRDHLAYVGQEPGLLSGTVADNVRLGFPHATDAAVADALRRAGAADLPPGQPVGDDAEGVSAGERRRIAVARALLRVTLGRAKLLVLDEPTAGLDADTEAGLLHTLRQLGVAALVVSHRPAVLAEADRVVRVGRAVLEERSGERGLRHEGTSRSARPALRDASLVPREAPQGSAEEDTAVQGAAEDDAAVQGAAEDDAAVQGAAGQDAPAQGAAGQDAPAQGAAGQDAPAQGSVEEDAPAQGAAGQDAPAQGAAEDDAAVQGAAARDADVNREGPLLRRLMDAVPHARARLAGSAVLAFCATAA
ncbi:MAG: thiol reductant ABC exporter subunit CydD, partial [Propionibacteriaceae bacterium]|nr:thiol reductant ABC exporter subunit CydD [Propionibacteriaceae bacterium]